MALVQLLLLALLGSALAGPILVSDSSDECATTCPETTKFGYTERKTYRYKYESKVSSHIAGAGTEQSIVTVSALAHIDVLSKCEMRLRLTDVKLTDASPTNPSENSNVEKAWDFKRSLQERSLRFAFQDGAVASVCPEAGEEKWVLNIKRAIVSGIQNTMNDLSTHTRNKDTDVSGECYVDYSSESSWNGFTITKVKDVLSCSRHANYDSFFQTQAFDVASRIQALPLLKSTHTCTQVINAKNELASTRCQEKHVFRPFSRGDSGATTDVAYTLELEGISDSESSQAGDVSSRESLIFDFEPKAEEQQAANRRNINLVRRALTDICAQTETKVEATAPATFANLIQKMRELTPDQLEDVHTQVKATPVCSRAEKFFHDAIPSLGTPASARMIRILLTSGELGANDADKWLTSLAFLTRPTRGLLADIKQLLAQDISFRKSTLAVTSLVHNYCQVYSDCGDHQEVKEIMTLLDQSLGYNCASTSHEQHKKIMSALKGIGNAGNGERTVAKLNRCILNAENDMETRVAAVQAFRRMPCTAARDELMNVFLSTSQDAELRINAYLMLMACPTTDIITRVKGRLQGEEVNQVGSFVWTHLTNLQETTSPFKQQVREILETETLKKAFNLDKRKFSRNIEWSAFADTLNLGATVDSNMIWSPKSFMPRSANLNLTLDAFGQSLNLMEVGGRSEGIDSMLESLFGPSNDIDDHIPNARRKRRSANEINPLHNQYDLKKDSPKGSYYIRMFGNEISFDDFHDISFSEAKKSIDPKPFLNKMSENHDMDYTRSGQFLDATMVVSTVAGLPLRLKTDGTAIVNMKVRGKFDIKNMLKQNTALHIEGSVRPSAAIQINGEMSVDAMMAKSGVRMENKLRTDTVADGKIELRDGAIFNMDINMPDERLEVFSANSKFFVEYRDTPREQAMLSNRAERRACFDSDIVRITGLELCGAVSYPLSPRGGAAPWYPLTGPASSSIVLTKKDTFTGFHFDGKYVKEEVSGSPLTKDIARVSFSTPGSKVDREFTFEYELDKPGNRVDMSLKTPFKNLEFQGSLVNTDTRKQLKATGKMDSATYDLLARLNIQENRFNKQYRPLVEITLPNREPYRLDGSVLYRAGKKADIDIKLENVMEGPLTVKGDVNYVKKDSKYQGSIEMDSPLFDAKIEGSAIRPNRNELTTDFQVEYKKNTGRKHTITHTMEWKAPSLDKTSPNVQLKTAFTTSQWSDYNSDIEVVLDANMKEGRFRLDGGLTGSTKRVTMVNSHKIVHNRKMRKGEISVSLAMPFRNIDYKEDLEYTMTAESLRINAKHRAGTVVTNMRAVAERQSKSPLKTLIELTFVSPGRNHIFRDTVEEKTSGKYEHNLLLELQPDWRAEVTSYYKRLPRHEVFADISIPNVRRMKIDGHLNTDFTDFSSAASFKYGPDLYSTSAMWTFAKDRTTVTSNSKLELVYPERTVLAKTALTASPSATTSEFEVKWDAVKDASKRFMFKSDSSHGNPGSVNLRAEWLANKFADLTVTRKSGQQSWRTAEGSYEAKMTFTSSFRNARSISVSFDHDRTARNMNSKTQISWDTNKKITSDVSLVRRNGLQDAILTAKTTTPFEGHRTSTYILDYSLRGNTFDSKNRYECDGKFGEFTLTGKADVPNHNFEGGVALRTSYEGWNRIDLSGRHGDDGKIYNSQIQGTWWDGSTASATLNMNHEASEWYVSNSGDLSISLPVRTYQNSKITWTHNNNNRVFKTHAEVLLNAEKSVFDLDSEFKSNRRQHACNLKTTFTSPYSGMRDLALTFDHQHDPRHYEGITTSGSVKYAPSKTITFNKRIDYKVGEFVKKTLAITTPYAGYETIDFEMENKIEGARFTLHKELKWGSNNKMALDGFVMLTYPRTNGEIRFISSFPNANRFFFSVENKQVNNVWQTNTMLEYPSNKKIELNTQVGWTNSKKFRVQLLTPYTVIDNFVFDLEHKGPANNFVTTVDVELPEYGKSAIKIQSDVRNVEDIDIKVIFTSDQEVVSSVRLDVNHKKSGSTYRSSIAYEHPGYKSSIANTLTLSTSKKEFDEKLELTHQNNKIETGIKLDLTPIIKFNIFYKCPHGRYNNMAFDFDFDNRDNTVMGALFTYDGNRIALNMDYTKSREGVTGNLVVATPFSRYERSTAAFNHRGKWNNFKNTASLSIGGRDFNTEGEFLYRPIKTVIGAKITTPYANYRTLSLDFDHSGDRTDMKQDLAIVYGDNNIKVTHEYKNKNDRINHKVLIITPYSVLSSLKTEFKHNGPWTNFKNEASLEYNGRVISGESEFKYGKRATKGSLSIKTPENYAISFVHKGSATDFTNKIDSEINGQTYTANTVFKFNRNNLELSTTIRTPHARLRVIQANINHRGALKNFQNSFQFNVNNNRYSGDAELKVVGTEVTASANFKLPETYSLTLTHKGGIWDFENNMVVVWDTNKYEGLSTFSKKGDTTSGSIVFKLPTEYSVRFGHTGNSKAFSNDFRLLINGHISTGNSRFHLRGNDLTASANLELPLETYDKFGITVKHQGVATNFKTDAELKLPLNKVKKVAFEVKHSGSFPEFESEAQVSYNRKAYGVSASHQGGADDFTTKAGYQNNGDKVEGELRWTKTGGRGSMNHNGHIKLTTPYDKLRQAQTKFVHSIQGNSYRGQIESLYNDVKYFDTEYTFSNEQKKAFTATMREPHPAFVNANYKKTRAGVDTDVTVNWDTADRDSNIKVALSALHHPKYEFEFKVVQPQRTTMFKTDFDCTLSSFDHGVAVQWGNGANKKGDYRVTGGYARSVYSGDFKLKSPYQDMEASIEHTRKARSVQTVLEIGNVEKLTIIQKANMKQPNFRNFDGELTIKHPRLQKDIKFEVEGILTPRPYAEGRVKIEFANDVVTFTGKLGDVSKAGNTAYIAEMRLIHPGTFTDFSFESEVGDNGEEVFGNLEVNHKSAVDKTMKTASLRSAINKLRRSLSLDLNTPFTERAHLDGRVSGEEGVYNLQVNAKVANERVLDLDLDLDRKTPLADLRIKLKNDQSARMYAKYLSVSTMQFEAYRQNGKNKLVDAILSLRLNNSRLIHGRAYFRPQFAEEHQAMFEGMDFSLLERVKNAIDDDIEHRGRYLRTRLQPIISVTRDMLRQADDVMERAENAYNDAYRRDHYYLKTSHQMAKRHYNQISEFSQEQYMQYKPMLDRHYERMAQGWEESRQAVADRHERLTTYMDNSRRQMADNFRTSYRKLAQDFEDFITAPWFSIMEEKLTEVYNTVYNRLKYCSERMRNHPYVQQTVTFYNSVKDSEYLQPLRDLHNDVTAHTERMRQHYNTAYNAAYRKLEEMFETVDMRKLQEWSQDLVTHGKQAYRYFGLHEVEETLRNLRAANMDELKTKAIRYVKDYLQLNRTRITVWEPTQGDYQFEIYLPAKLHNLRDFPVDEIRRQVATVRRTLASLKPDDTWIPWDTIYDYKISTNPMDWIPPFPAHATLAGNQHFMTFDKKFYEFSGECSYLLTHDFIDGNFSVVVNYDNVEGRMSKKSISVHSNGKQVEIFPSYKVTIDGARTELPVEFDDTTVVRRGNTIRLDNENGLTVTCDLPYDRCTVNVTGWYFAKTAGLFGTYNNEPFDDVMTVEGGLATSPELLADSWTVGRKCRVANNAEQRVIEDFSKPNSAIYKTCAKYFEDQNSNFRPCFRQVDNKPFMQMCINDLAKRDNLQITDNDVCDIAAFYVDECGRHGVPLRQPSSCVTCKLGDARKFKEYEDQRLNGPDVPQSADVVFVMSHKPCSKDVMPKMKKLLDSIEDSLVENGLRNNRYGVVGFGGQGVLSQPHAHTIEGQLFNRDLKVAQMITDLPVTSQESEDDEGEHAIDALEMAARYPFRAGVSKTLVLFTCETCSENIVSYPDMVELLLKRDIKLHLISPHDFRMRSNSPKANNILGMTRYTVYTNKHVGKLGGDVTLRRQTYMPKDLCAALSHDTDGAIFNANKFSDAKWKDLRTIFAGVTAAKASPSECQVCECVPDESGVGQPVCHSCNSKTNFYAVLPKFEDYGVGNFMDSPGERMKPIKKVKKLRNLRQKKRRGRNQ